MSSTTTLVDAPPELPPRSTLDRSAIRLSDRVLAWADRHRRWIFLAILALYVAGFSTQWRLEPDSALYLSIGRNLVEGEGYTYNGKDHRLAYPGLPLVFASVFKVFGTASLLPHLILMWLIGLAALGLTYRLFLLHAGRPTAVLMMLGVAVSRVFYRYGFELLSDMPFLLGVMAFFVGYEAIFHRRTSAPGEQARPLPPVKWYDGVLLVAGLAFAISTRPAMWALVAAAAGTAAIAMAWSSIRGRPRWGYLAIIILVIGTVFLFYLKDPRSKSEPGGLTSTSYIEEDQLFQIKRERFASMFEVARHNVPGVFEHALTEASFGTSIVPGLNTFLAIVIAIAGVLLARRRPLWGMWVLATLLMVMLLRKPLDRYFLPIVPVLVFAWWNLVRWVEGRLGGRWANIAFLVLFALGAVPNTVRMLGFVYEQRYTPFLANYKRGRYSSIYEVARQVEAQTPPSGLASDHSSTWIFVPTKFSRILSFLGRRHSVEPDVGTFVNPDWPNVFVLEPSEALHPEAGEAMRPKVNDWLAKRGHIVASGAIGPAIPNTDPDDSRPWTLHRVNPIGAPASVLSIPPSTAANH